MAVRSQEMRSTTVRPTTTSARPIIVSPTVSLHSVAYLVTGLLALIAIYAVMGNMAAWGRSRWDDMRYGNPRTYHLDAAVGHGDGSGTLTHLLAMNLNRQVVIMELPGGDASKVRTLTGPYLFGADEDKTPVLMRLDDLNHDGAKDLVVSIKNEEIVYFNRDGQFQIATPEERTKLTQASSQPLPCATAVHQQAIEKPFYHQDTKKQSKKEGIFSPFLLFFCVSWCLRVLVVPF